MRPIHRRSQAAVLSAVGGALVMSAAPPPWPTWLVKIVTATAEHGRPLATAGALVSTTALSLEWGLAQSPETVLAGLLCIAVAGGMMLRETVDVVTERRATPTVADGGRDADEYRIEEGGDVE